MKTLTGAMAFVVLVTGLIAGCSNGSEVADGGKPSDERTSDSKSPKVEESHSFSGKGSRINGFLGDDELVTLSGDYDVSWQVNGNTTSSGGESIDAPFEVSIFCEIDRVTNNLVETKIANEIVSEGEGKNELSVSDPQRCQLNVVASDSGEWKVSVERQ